MKKNVYADKLDKRQEVLYKIQEYFMVGGLFNPELMDHDKVSELIKDCRDVIQTSLEIEKNSSKYICMKILDQNSVKLCKAGSCCPIIKKVEDNRFEVIAAILEGATVEQRKHNYRVSNSMSGIYIKGNFNTKYIPKFREPDKIFTLDVKITKLAPKK